jgi:DNA-binding transcriptional LysR family regulator|tara:strand:- start:21063 stop:21944 length:882 start_codon:yes stop_codon:yes gene_type:complete
MKYSLRQLEIFLAIARQQNISRAAETLHMSQSAASAALQNLEQAYNISLFNRIGKKLELNEVGKTLRSKAEILISHAHEFDQAMQGHTDIGHLKVGASFTIGNHLAVTYLARYLNKHPEAQVDINVANSSAIAAQVLNFEVDIGMIEGQVNHKDLALIPWRDDSLVVFCSPEHPLAKKKNLSEKDILQARWILREPESGARQTFNRALAELLPMLDIYLEFKHNEAIKKAVEAGLGIGCLSEIVLQNNFKSGELVPLKLPKRDMKRTFYFALPKNRYRTAAIEEWMAECCSGV